MRPFLLLLSFIILGFHAPAFSAEEKALPTYHVDLSKSRLSFRAIIKDDVLEGLFSNFTTDIKFDPEQLDKSKIVVRVKTADLRINEPQLLDEMRSGQWLSVEQYPEAVFESTELNQIPKTDDFYGKGTMTIRGVQQPVEVSFRQRFNNGDHVVVEGYMTLQRKAYGLDPKEKDKSAAIKEAVRIDFRLYATKEN